MEITSLNQLKIMGVTFQGLTMAHFQTSTSYHSLVCVGKWQLPHSSAEMSLQLLDTTEFRKIHLAYPLISCRTRSKYQCLCTLINPSKKKQGTQDAKG